MKKTKIIKIHRQDSKTSKPTFKEYEIEVDHHTSLLDAILEIRRTQDPTISIRYSCHHAVCGSCGITINGKPGLACQTPIYDCKNPIIVEPMKSMPVLKDLIVSWKGFLNQFKQIKPWLINKEKPENNKEYLMSSEDQLKVDQANDCIMCGLCDEGCKQDKDSISPANIVQAFRKIFDTRDKAQKERLDQIQSSSPQTRNCSKYCPKNIDPDHKISQIKDKLD